MYAGMMARVLLVDGDAALRAELTTLLTVAGHDVEVASNAQAGVAVARASRPNVVIFDLELPDGSGTELCRTLRNDPAAGRLALMVLAKASTEDDRVAAFEAGADDFVAKPASMRELLLRVRALARRRSSNAPSPTDTVVLGPLRIERAARRVDLQGKNVELTRREFDVLLHLADRAGRVQTRDALVADVWGEVADSGRVVDTTIKRLRKKLGDDAPPIRTVRGVGYKIVAE